MNTRVASFACAGVLLLAAGYALFHTDATSATSAEPEAAQAGPQGGQPMAANQGTADPPLPPNHPPIGQAQGGMGTGTGSGMPVSSAIPTSDEPGGIVWKLPASWTPAPNPSPMRLATYKPTPDTEVSVSRAGGATDANIQRWVGQFKDASAPVRTQKTVSSLHVEEVFVTGAFGGGGMMPGAASGDHPGTGRRSESTSCP